MKKNNKDVKDYYNNNSVNLINIGDYIPLWEIPEYNFKAFKDYKLESIWDVRIINNDNRAFYEVLVTFDDFSVKKFWIHNLWIKNFSFIDEILLFLNQ